MCDASLSLDVVNPKENDMSSDDSYKRVPPKSLDMNAIKQEARKLKQKKGWNPDHFVTEDPLEKLRQLN